MGREGKPLSHTKWECKYHVVFIPKCRRKTLYRELRQHLGEVFRKLAVQKQSRIAEGHLLPDHVHLMIAIAPKYAVAQGVGFSRAKARFSWRECTESRRGILSGSISGREDITCPRWAGMRRSSVTTSGNKGRRPAIGPNQPVALTGHRQSGPPTVGAALATPLSRFERLTT